MLAIGVKVKCTLFSSEDYAKITLAVRIGYRQKDDDVNGWQELASSFEEREISCRIDEDQVCHVLCRSHS